MTEFLLIRHALTDAADHWYAGRMPGVTLNGRGHQQAAALAQRLENFTLDALYSSPLERCLETAEPIAKASGRMVVTDDAFTEIDCGDWTGKPFEELRKEDAFARFNSFRCGTRPPNGELMVEVQARMVAGILRLAERHKDQTVAIVTHSDAIKAVLAYFLGIPLDLSSRLVTDPASVSIFELRERDARVRIVNHLGPLGLQEV
ncbi:MAG: histidine phosphatase family protein [Pyrinomonadaceae bacterium]